MELGEFSRAQLRAGSILGAGAAVALAIAALTLVALFLADPVYQKVALGAALWYALGLLYFAVYGRKRLVYSPEEAFAAAILSQQKKRPEESS